MKLFKRIILQTMLIIVLTISVLFSGHISINAATFGVTASNNGNGTTTVTVSGQVAGGFTVSVNGQSAKVYINDIGGNASTTFKTGAGTFKVTAEVISVTDKDYNLIPPGTQVEGSVTVTNSQTTNSDSKPIQPQQQQKPSETEKPKNEEKKSGDNTLASLSVSKGTLSPKFSVDVNAYEVNLSNDNTSIDINAKAKDAKASVRGIGKQTLKAGKNTFVVSVTAENGNVKNYTIQVNVDEKPSLYVDYNGVKLGVVTNLGDVDGPNKSFEKTKVKIDGKDVVAWENNVLGKTVVYLMDDKTGEKNYYVYNTSTNKIETILKPATVLGHNFYIVDIDKNMQNKEGMTFGMVNIEKHDFPGWKFKDAAFKNYALIYVMNEKGEMAYYQYESTEKTLQLYSEAAPYTLKEYNDTKKSMMNAIEKRNIIIGVLAALCVILFILALCFFIRKKKRVKYPKMDIQDKKFDDRFHIEADALTQDDEKE